MAAVYQRLDVVLVRAVAAAAVRDADNQAEFLTRASAALDTQVEIVSGQEEARMIHLGVRSRWPHPKCRNNREPRRAHVARLLKTLGALRLQEVFLKTDPPRAEDLHRLEEYIEERIGDLL